MKRSIIALLCVLWLALALSAQAQTPVSESQQQAALNRQLLAEIKFLRRELLEQAIEFQRWKLEQINRELEKAQTEQAQLLHQEQLLQQELNELAVVSDNNNELEALRTELAGEQSQKLRRLQQPVGERVNTLTVQAQKEEKRLVQLTDKMKAEAIRNK